MSTPDFDPCAEPDCGKEAAPTEMESYPDGWIWLNGHVHCPECAMPARRAFIAGHGRFGRGVNAWNSYKSWREGREFVVQHVAKAGSHRIGGKAI